MRIKDLIAKYKTDEVFRNKVGLYGGAISNLIFVAVQLYGGIRYQSVWFTVLAVYYAVLSVVKFYIGRCINNKGKEAWKTLRITGCVMVILNLALIAMISIMVANPSIALHKYSVIISVITAFFTLISAGMAIYGVIKVQKKHNPVFLADRLVQLITAAVSILMLQTSLIASTNSLEIESAREVVAQFGSLANIPSELFQILSDTFSGLIMSNRVTGIIVAFIVGGITVYMIAKGIIEERKLRLSAGKASLSSSKHR